MRNWFVAAIVLVNLVCLAYCQRRAVCVLSPTVWAPYVQGTLFLDTNEDGTGAVISGTITGAPPNGLFGFHIHDYGHIGTPDGLGTGGHFNPFGDPHALPPVTPRHVGDMGNLTSNSQGTIAVSKSGTDVLWTLNGTTSAIGRGLILHAKGDDGGQPTGNAGNRMAQCVVGVRMNTPNRAMADAYPWNYATAEIRGTLSTSSHIVGRVTFTTTGANVRVQGKVCGFAPFSQHGFHVHEFGDLSGSPADTNLGSHFNPVGNPHGWQDNPVRHLGDMGNITADAFGVATIDLTLNLLTLTGNNSILGRAVVIHSAPDDGGQPTGNSQVRYAAGIIGAVNSVVTFNDILCNATRLATCALESTTGNNVTGVLTFAIDEFGVPKLSGKINGLAPNSIHGIHVHQWGYLTANGQGVGAHFNPLNVTHGLPGGISPVRHIGDLGNHTADANGVISLNLVGQVWNLWRLEGMLSVLGRGLIIHALADDGSDPVGNSGARMAQCVIGVTRTATLADNKAINDNPGTTYATCEVRVAKSSYGNITGRVVFSVSGGVVTVRAKICGLPRSTNHGFHVHEFGDLSDPVDLTANTGGHFNPYNVPHALPSTLPRHLGDMGNLVVDANGVGTIDTTVNTLTLAGNDSIIGRAVIIHTNPDDGSQPTGGAGTKLAACIVGVIDKLVDFSDVVCPPLPAPTPPPKGAAASAYVSILAAISALLAMLLMM